MLLPKKYDLNSMRSNTIETHRNWPVAMRLKNHLTSYKFHWYPSLNIKPFSLHDVQLWKAIKIWTDVYDVGDNDNDDNFVRFLRTWHRSSTTNWQFNTSNFCVDNPVSTIIHIIGCTLWWNSISMFMCFCACINLNVYTNVFFSFCTTVCCYDAI